MDVHFIESHARIHPRVAFETVHYKLAGGHYPPVQRRNLTRLER
jgi:hypothetical protein